MFPHRGFCGPVFVDRLGRHFTGKTTTTFYVHIPQARGRREAGVSTVAATPPNHRPGRTPRIQWSFSNQASEALPLQIFHLLTANDECRTFAAWTYLLRVLIGNTASFLVPAGIGWI